MIFYGHPTVMNEIPTNAHLNPFKTWIHDHPPIWVDLVQLEVDGCEIPRDGCRYETSGS